MASSVPLSSTVPKDSSSITPRMSLRGARAAHAPGAPDARPVAGEPERWHNYLDCLRVLGRLLRVRSLDSLH